MRRTVILGWLLLVNATAQAVAPIDLESPFLKTALILEKTGTLGEKEVQGGRFQANMLELVKADGGLLVLPVSEVIAVLPRLPSGEERYLQADAKKALLFLRMAQPQLPERPEVSAANLIKWEELAGKPAKEDQQREADLTAWFLKCQEAVSTGVNTEQLERLTNEGTTLLEKNPDKTTEIKRELTGLQELGRMDLDKIQGRKVGLGKFGENFLPGTLLWLLVILPAGVGLGCFSGGIQRFRNGAVLAGVVWFFPAVLACVWLFALVGPGFFYKPEITQTTESAVARRAFWLSVNHLEKWADQVSKKVPVPEDDWLAFLSSRTTDGDEAGSSPSWYLGKPELRKSKGNLDLIQPICANFLVLVFDFSFRLPHPGQSWTDLELVGASVGKLPLGCFIGQFVWQKFESSYQPWKEAFGLNQGVRWLAGEGGKVIVVVPQTQLPETKLVLETTQAKESLSAKELAEVFDQGLGKIYRGKIITVEGNLLEVISMQETVGIGTKLQQPDPMDEFILEGIPEGAGRKLDIRVRCQFKSPDTYFLDSKGDLYKSAPQAQSAKRDWPILRSQDGVTRVRMGLGRVESAPSENRIITLYDCRIVEGYDGKDWKKIWPN